MIKTLLAVSVLALMPIAALAGGCSGGVHGQQAQSCATGSSWDPDTQRCLPIVTG